MTRLAHFFLLLPLLMSATFFAPSATAQDVGRAPSTTNANRFPTVIMECDDDQCTNPRKGGGAMWVFEGQRGQAMWRYGAVASLTIERFDGQNVVIRRIDPDGTYSSQFAPKGQLFTAVYTGTLRGNHISGKVSWGGTWSAEVLNRPCDASAKCPLNSDQMFELGENAARANLNSAARRCFLISAWQGNPRAQIRLAQIDGQAPLEVGSTGVANQKDFCAAKPTIAAMQRLEEQSMNDPNGAALTLLGCAFTGVCASSERPTAIDGKIGSDGGKYTAKDPGSFVCRGIFLRGEVHMETTSDADAASQFTEETMKSLLATHPSFVEWFKVKPLQSGRYHVELLPSSLQLSRVYSVDMVYP